MPAALLARVVEQEIEATEPVADGRVQVIHRRRVGDVCRRSASAPACRQRSAVSSSGAAWRPATTTVNPSLASTTAVARPIPEPAPVTNAILIAAMPRSALTLACAIRRAAQRRP
jgi:hypothetical protein